MIPYRGSKPLSLDFDAITTINSTHTLVWRDTVISPRDGGKTAGGTLSNSQTRAILVAALSCACFSLVFVLITLRWFLIMRRSFRHRLVLYLIISDTLKAIWYFVFPIVVFARGPVASTSNFCQASGFLLAFALEANDMAILIIAVHSILYILRPNNAVGEGGLYRYRGWIYLWWLGPPLVAASLAFINDKDGYVTAGTFCYLPKRPFWYRLALSWVPRYLIISLILIMYIWIYIYVHVKFRGFDNLGETDSSYDSAPRRKPGLSTKLNDVLRRGTDQIGQSLHSPASAFNSWQPQYQSPRVGTSEPLQHWEHMGFIAARALQDSIAESAAGNEAVDMLGRGSGWSGETQILPAEAAAQAGSSNSGRQTGSDDPSTTPPQHDDLNRTPDFQATKPIKTSDGPKDPLQKTRIAIRRQLRYLFIYPLVYIVMWSFPFASHALNYNEYYVQHPVFWLSVVQTVMLSLQAGVDSIIFSFSEKPWRRVDSTSMLSIAFVRRRSKAFLTHRSPEKPAISTSAPPSHRQPFPNQNPTWWEAEGRRRNDSVWLGTSMISDLTSPITTRTRSRSPQKSGRGPHSGTRSSVQGTGLVPQLEPILPGTLKPTRRPPLTSVASDASIKRPQSSSQSPSTLPEPEELPNGKTDNSA